MKKNKITLLLIISFFLLYSSYSFSKENISQSTSHDEKRSLALGCAPASAMVDLDINNVRAKIIAGGEMWWDLTNSGYEVPIGSGKHSLYAGSLWIGGIDAGSQLKIAAQTYRQTGNDYYPGPLSTTGIIDPATCLSYDKLWKINKADVVAYHNWVVNGSFGAPPIGSSQLQTILDWPTVDPEGNPLAPYFDYNSDGFYDPTAGDYPKFDLNNTGICNDNQLYGDQMIWWVFNDNGNTHSETGGAAIGLEVQAQAFGFSTSDVINDITFYKYKIINQSPYTLNNTYFGQWVDPDLGTYSDDYVGCDVERGLGYCYNGNATDVIYGANPPAIGIDFLQGPYQDADGSDNPLSSVPSSFTNYGDGITDNERLGMGRFVYYNNDASNYGNPTSAAHFYYYLKGIWKNNTPIKYGGNGQSGTLSCNYMFPGISDPIGWGVGGTTASPLPQTNWSEAAIPNPVGDRRFLESAGPFTLQPGAVNNITTAVIWAQATSGGPSASVQKLFDVDDYVQGLFNNCFVATGISTNKVNGLNVRIYPNPFYEKAILSFANLENEPYRLTIYDLTGKLVQTYNTGTNNNITITKDQLRSGTYIYELSNSKKNKASTGKFIIK